MGKLEYYALNLDSVSASYIAGQIVSGSVDIRLSDAMMMRGIHVKILGRADVHWTEQRTTYSDDKLHTTTESYDNKETYIREIIVLVGSADSDNCMTLPAGSHHYTFSVTLPANCPSSFKSDVGQIRYSVQATIDKPWKFDHDITKSSTITRPFTVCGVLDLNTLQPAQLREPSVTNATAEVACCCWSSGYVSATCQLNRLCFVPGEEIQVNVQINNDSKDDITCAKLHFNQKCVFRASGGHTKAVTTKLTKIDRETAIAPSEKVKEWSNKVTLPADLPFTTRAGSNIIQVSYELKIVVEAAMFTTLNLPNNIIIGSVPLPTPQLQQPLPDDVITMQPCALGSRPHTPPPAYADCLGPSATSALSKEASLDCAGDAARAT